MNLNSLWPQEPGKDGLADYFRAVCTGPATPLVLSTTTSGDRLNVGLTYRTAVFFRSGCSNYKSKFPGMHKSDLILERGQSCPHIGISEAVTSADEAVRPPIAVLFAACLNILACALAVGLTGCATYKRSGLPPAKVKVVEQQFHLPSLSPDLEDEILALDPLHVSERDIREVLSHAAAPRIINIHGGIYPVHRRMISFSPIPHRHGLSRVQHHQRGGWHLYFQLL